MTGTATNKNDRSSGPSVRKLGLWAGAAGAVLLMLGISAIASHADDRGDGMAHSRLAEQQRSPVEPLR